MATAAPPRAVHHIVFYCLGGVTLPHNLLLICGRCHKHLHEGHLRVVGTAPGALRWTDRHGQGLVQVTQPIRPLPALLSLLACLPDP